MRALKLGVRPDSHVGVYRPCMRCKFLPAAVVLAVLSVTPASAWAARPATAEEQAAVLAVYGTSPDCSQVTVSERDGRYARWDFVASETCEPAGNGFGVARRGDDGKWVDVYQASEDSDACPTTPLPTEVGVELRACSRQSKDLYITHFLSERALVKPRKLPHGAHSFLGPLRWRGWGRSVTTASGVLDYADRTARFKAPIRLRASRVRFCGAKRVYRRLTRRFVRAADRRRYPHFEGATRLGCPQR